MQSYDLTRDQARALLVKLEPMLDYLNKLRHRMQSKGFPLDDPLWLTVSKAQGRNDATNDRIALRKLPHKSPTTETPQPAPARRQPASWRLVECGRGATMTLPATSLLG